MRPRGLLVVLAAFAAAAAPHPALAQNKPAPPAAQGRELPGAGVPRTGGSIANPRDVIAHFQQAVKPDPNFAPLPLLDTSRAWSTLDHSNPDGAATRDVPPPAKAAPDHTPAAQPRLNAASSERR